MLRGFLWLTAACGFVLSWMVLLCSEAGAAFMVYALERQAQPIRAEQLRQVQAIVLLSGRIDRLKHAADLHRQTGLPLLVTGKGGGDSYFPAESMTMEAILRKEQGLQPRWVEVESVDTVENALYSACLLAPLGIRKVALVTDPMHMPRSRVLFLAAGFSVVPAPAFDEPAEKIPLTLDSFVPSSDGMIATRRALREWAGIFAQPVMLLLRRGSCPASSAVH